MLGRSHPRAHAYSNSPIFARVALARMATEVTMEKIVSLCRRRGFVFPASEIYGVLASSYDYGHYGVLLKENVKARWLEAMVRER